MTPRVWVQKNLRKQMRRMAFENEYIVVKHRLVIFLGYHTLTIHEK